MNAVIIPKNWVAIPSEGRSPKEGYFSPILSVQNIMDLILILFTFQIGTCYAPRECREKNGTGAGECAQGYGVCCVCKSFPTVIALN